LIVGRQRERCEIARELRVYDLYLTGPTDPRQVVLSRDLDGIPL
jgi:hypothetical protein